MTKQIVPVILCGGAGTRLWPASRDSYPKQFLTLNSRRSLFQDTLARVAGAGYGRPIVLSGNAYRFLVADQAQALGIAADIVLEPARRDSCAAIAAAAAVAVSRDPEAVVLVLSADHDVPDQAAFQAHVARGLAGALLGRIVTFGIQPTFPATGYGYIRPGPALPVPGIHAIAAFVEKPDLATAERYQKEGYLWNSGNFLFRAQVFLDELKALAPDIHDPVVESVAAASRDLDFLRLSEPAFTRARATSVDYAVMEKTALSAVVPSDFRWSDIGSWAAVADMAEKDAAGNSAHGDAMFENARNCYIYSPDTLTSVVGLDNVVVVATRDAILVTDRSNAEDVKKLVGRLSSAGRREAVEHLKNYRPWGHYEQIDRGARYQVKRITVAPGAKLSLQSHFHRAEHWVVVTGTARVTVDDKVHLLGENQSIYIPLGAVHRMENPGQIPLELIEVQSGSYLGEDDIVRYEDDYNRS
ncbi:MAG TPA: mannose-1-phosphate guanylyltransferase/mannose-6-phosphate isomerase [Beijerinckiaceae bacterium]|nr:mannose-1-phosphate guanylyltransferase/mannose-6-phosphate isomerase [Beijerinckiaceae bacterium]